VTVVGYVGVGSSGNPCVVGSTVTGRVSFLVSLQSTRASSNQALAKSATTSADWIHRRHPSRDVSHHEQHEHSVACIDRTSTAMTV
jgi:hypothetical protein